MIVFCSISTLKCCSFPSKESPQFREAVSCEWVLYFAPLMLDEYQKSARIVLSSSRGLILQSKSSKTSGYKKKMFFIFVRMKKSGKFEISSSVFGSVAKPQRSSEHLAWKSVKKLSFFWFSSPPKITTWKIESERKLISRSEAQENKRKLRNHQKFCLNRLRRFSKLNTQEERKFRNMTQQCWIKAIRLMIPVN